MFVAVRFGYLQRRFFTIDSLTASLSDCIWANCVQDVIKNLEVREAWINKEIAERVKKTPVLEKKLETLDAKIKASLPQAPVDPKKGPAPAKPPAATGKKGKDVQLSPEEEELAKLTSELESNKKAIETYQEKLKRIPEIKARFVDYSKMETVVVDLLDRGGERKFMNLKKDSKGNEFLGDKNIYHLARIKPAATADGRSHLLLQPRRKLNHFTMMGLL